MFDITLRTNTILCVSLHTANKMLSSNLSVKYFACILQSEHVHENEIVRLSKLLENRHINWVQDSLRKKKWEEEFYLLSTKSILCFTLYKIQYIIQGSVAVEKSF